MLKNYTILSNGVIKQLNVVPKKYDEKYIIDSYDSYGELGKRMSYLRYGFILGTLGFIPKSILDVGYGNGDFLSICKETISDCYGYDVSGYKIPKGCTFINNLEINVDVITFFDSLEHFEDINFVKNLNVKYVVISVPWCHNFSDEWLLNWKHLRPNEHIYHFSKNALIDFMLENGYTCINSINVEDIIRKNVSENENILTAIFKKL